MKNFKKNNHFLSQKKPAIAGAFSEREGFEPSVTCATHAFQACSLGLSDTFPFIYSIDEMIDSQTLSDPLFASMLFKSPSFL